MNTMRTMPGDRDACKSYLHCPAIYADELNRLWTICDLPRCIHDKEGKE